MLQYSSQLVSFRVQTLAEILVLMKFIQDVMTFSIYYEF